MWVWVVIPNRPNDIKVKTWNLNDIKIKSVEFKWNKSKEFGIL